MSIPPADRASARVHDQYGHGAFGSLTAWSAHPIRRFDWPRMFVHAG